MHVQDSEQQPSGAETEHFVGIVASFDQYRRCV